MTVSITLSDRGLVPFVDHREKVFQERAKALRAEKKETAKLQPPTEIDKKLLNNLCTDVKRCEEGGPDDFHKREAGDPDGSHKLCDEVFSTRVASVDYCVQKVNHEDANKLIANACGSKHCHA